MKLDLKRQIDHFIGVPALWITGLSARVVGAVLRRKRARLPVRNILIMKFQGIGSLAIALPAIKALREEHHEARLAFWGTPATVALAKRSQVFDAFYVLNDASIVSSVLSLVRTLPSIIKTHYDWAFDLEVYSKLSSILLTLTCARNRAGFAIDSVAHRTHTHTHLILFNRYRYLGEAVSRLFSLCTERLVTASDRGAYVFDVSASNLDQTLKSVSYIVLNPNVGELAKVRAWSEKKFAVLIDYLAKRFSEYKFILVGKGDDELAVATRIETELKHSHYSVSPGRVLNLANRLNLEGLIDLLRHSKLVVTADTSILHLASLELAPTVALFGPTLEKTYMNENPQWKSKSVSTQLYCRPCVHHWPTTPCKGDNQCMKKIEVSDVLNAAFELMGLPISETSTSLSSIDEPSTPSRYFPGLVYQRLER
jgi:ADP-heptose:LPS heptosyltransferase